MSEAMTKWKGTVMIPNKRKGRIENDHKASDATKTNEALSMRCQISLSKMTQLLMDDARFSPNYERDQFRDRIMSASAKKSSGNATQDGIREKREPPVKQEPVVRTHKKRNRQPKQNLDDKMRHKSGDRLEEVLPSESWLQFVRKSRNKGSAVDYVCRLMKAEHPSQSIFSRFIEIERESISSNNSSPTIDGSRIYKSPDGDGPNVCRSSETIESNNYKSVPSDGSGISKFADGDGQNICKHADTKERNLCKNDDRDEPNTFQTNDVPICKNIETDNPDACKNFHDGGSNISKIANIDGLNLNCKTTDTDGPTNCGPVENDKPDLDSCSDGMTTNDIATINDFEKTTSSPTPTQSTPPLESKKAIDEVDQTEIDSMVAQKRLSKYKSPPQSATKNYSKKNNFRCGITNLNRQRRRFVDRNCAETKGVSINGSKVPIIDSTSPMINTLKKYNAAEQIDASEHRQNDFLEGWRQDVGGQDLTATHSGGAIVEYSFENIHNQRPAACYSTVSLCATESTVVPVSRSCSSISFNTYQSRSEILFDRTNSSLADFIQDQPCDEDKLRPRSRVSSAMFEWSIKEFDINNNVDRSHARSNANGDDVYYHANEHGSSIDNKDNDNTNVNDIDGKSNSDDKVSGNDSDKIDNNDNADHNHNAEDEVSSDIWEACPRYSSCAELSNIYSIFSFDSCSSYGSCSKDSPKLPNLSDGISDNFSFNNISPSNTENPNGAQPPWYSNNVGGILPTGYYEGISSRYIQPVVVPPPFPGRDRAKMVMKVKANEAKSGTNMLVKFKSDIKDSSSKSHSDWRDGSSLAIKNCSIDFKENATRSPAKPKRWQRTRPLLPQRPNYKPVIKNTSSFVQRNIHYVNSPKQKIGQKNILRLPVIDCDLRTLSYTDDCNVEEISFVNN